MHNAPPTLPDGSHLLLLGEDGLLAARLLQAGMVVSLYHHDIAAAQAASLAAGLPVRVCRLEQLSTPVPFAAAWLEPAHFSVEKALSHLPALLKPGASLYLLRPTPLPTLTPGWRQMDEQHLIRPP